MVEIRIVPLMIFFISCSSREELVVGVQHLLGGLVDATAPPASVGTASGSDRPTSVLKWLSIARACWLTADWVIPVELG
jgi:hypothetical protein